MFVYELSGCGFEFHWSHLKMRLPDTEKELSNLNAKKSTFKSLPANIFKISKNTCPETLKTLLNKTVPVENFPNELKLANMAPFFIKESPLKLKKLQAYKCITSCIKNLVAFKNYCNNSSNIDLKC